MRLFLILICFLVASACGEAAQKPNTVANTAANTAKTPAQQLPVYGYEIVKEYPHDPRAFTQGLIFYNGFLYESTGQEKAASTVRKVDIATGKVVQKFDLPKTAFGEGITLLNGKIYLLTWRGGVGYVLNADTLVVEREFNYLGEGWGITNDGTNLFITQGAHVLKVIDPGTFNTLKTIPVMQPNGQPLMQLNEMEFIKGEIWANIWHSEDPKVLGRPNYIARINPADGKLLGWIDLAGISPDDIARSSEHTLNGIAHDPATDRIFVTGKNWRKLFEIKIKEPAAK